MYGGDLEKVRIFGKGSGEMMSGGGGGSGGVRRFRRGRIRGKGVRRFRRGRSRRGSVWRAWGYRIWKRE